jgi:octaprenyl-diphosphate synthase
LELSDIHKPVQEGLVEVEERLKTIGEVESSWLSELLDYCLKGGGKRLRPMLVLLSGKFYEYNLERLLLIAMAVELTHLATLVHDDTIDNSSVRWGRPTINKLWGTEQAVLLGDYLFAKAGELTADTENLRVIRGLARTLMIISSGELAQAYSAFSLEQNRENYLQRISSKTASLFSFSTESGAVLSQAPEETIDVLTEYGYNFGVAFQIVDDILDFIGTEEEMGKPVGSDLTQGTLTLPAMLLVERHPGDNPIKRLFKNGLNEEDIKQAIELVCNSSIIDECFKVAADYCDKACHRLNLLPDNENRQALIDLADYIIRRRR